MSRIVDRLARVQEVDAELAAVNSERQEYMRWLAARRDERVLAEQAHAEAADRAIAAGEPPPAEPVDPWPHERHVQRVAALQQVRAELALSDLTILSSTEPLPRIREFF